jgi:hypothetical protein
MTSRTSGPAAGRTRLRAGIEQFGPALATVAVAGASIAALRPPRAAGADAPPDRFSAARAARHLDVLAAEPRPPGSPAADRARDYIRHELARLGFDVEIQDAVGANDLGPAPYGPRYRGAGRVRNIVAHLAGSPPGPAVMLMVHYDSVSHGPGASDAGVPLAAMLEAVRALRTGPAPRTDLLVVVTDGEEGGLLGSRAFFEEHPRADSVGIVFNFDARGTTGPVLMFETGSGNGPAIAALARVRSPVFASSMFVEVYRRLPNATDFTTSKDRGVPGLNFAHIGGFVRYHGELDDLAHVDHGSLQHHGELALDLVRRHTASAATVPGSGSDSVFFTVGRGRMVRYPVAASVPLTLAAGAICASGCWRWARGRPSRWWADGLAALTGRLAVSGAGAMVTTWALGRISPESHRSGDFHASHLLYPAVAGVAAAAGALFGPGGSESAEGCRRLAAATVPLSVVNPLLTRLMPGASYLTTWPLLGGGVGLHLLAAKSPTTRACGATAAAMPAAALLAPLSRLLFDGLTPRMAWTAAMTLRLLGEFAGPGVRRLPAPVRRLGAAAGLGAGAVQLARFVAGRGDPAANPRPETLGYLLDADTGDALWLSSDPAPNGWTRRALGAWPCRGPLPRYFAGWRREFLHAPAPPLSLPAPEVDVVDVTRRADGWLVGLRVRSPRGARQVWLCVPAGGVRRWSVEGRGIAPATDGEAGPWELWLHAVPATGLRVDLEVVPGAEPMEIRVADRSHGIPAELAQRLRANGPEPPGRMQAASLDVETWGNGTWVMRQVKIR